MTASEILASLEGAEFQSSLHEGYVCIIDGKAWSEGEIVEPRISKPLAEYFLACSFADQFGAHVDMDMEPVYKASRYAKKVLGYSR